MTFSKKYKIELVRQILGQAEKDPYITSSRLERKLGTAYHNAVAHLRTLVDAKLLELIPTPPKKTRLFSGKKFYKVTDKGRRALTPGNLNLIEELFEDKLVKKRPAITENVSSTLPETPKQPVEQVFGKMHVFKRSVALGAFARELFKKGVNSEELGLTCAQFYILLMSLEKEGT